MKRLAPIVVAGGLAVGFISGCCHNREAGIISQQVPPASIVFPQGAIPAAPPGTVVTPPPGATISPPVMPGAVPPPPAFPSDGAASKLGPQPPTEDNWQPVEGRQPFTQSPAPPIANQQTDPNRQPPLARIQLAPPEPIQDKEPPAAAKTQPPDPEPPMAQAPPPTTQAQEPRPPLKTEERPPAKSFSFPVGIPQFAPIKERVATGLRPSLDEGLDWLQKQGYRGVLYVRRPGDPDSADRSQVEKRGMTYLTIEVAPDTLSDTIVADFIAMVNDSANRPIFVYDRDGALAGGLWYLYFRRADNNPDDTARVRAGSLGFREDRDDAHREMWQAVQKLLNR